MNKKILEEIKNEIVKVFYRDQEIEGILRDVEEDRITVELIDWIVGVPDGRYFNILIKDISYIGIFTMKKD